MLPFALFGGSSLGFSMCHKIVRMGMQRTPLLQEKNILQRILWVMTEETPPHCSTMAPQFHHSPLTTGLPNISHPILYALQQAIDSGLCCLPLITMLSFYLTLLCSRPSSLTSTGKAQAERLFSLQESIEYYKKSAYNVFYTTLVFIYTRKEMSFNNLVI